MFPKSRTGEGTYRPSAGNLCLDFVNTMGGNRHGKSTEYLATYPDLVAFGEMTGALTKAVAQPLARAAADNPERAAEVLERARALREAVYRIVSAVRDRKVPVPDDLLIVSREAALAVTRARITAGSSGLSWEWPSAAADLDRALWPLARAASDLLTSSLMAQVRECASETCTWVFRDASKNQSRRWCDMKDCGNREKARRHRHR